MNVKALDNQPKTGYPVLFSPPHPDILCYSIVYIIYAADYIHFGYNIICCQPPARWGGTIIINPLSHYVIENGRCIYVFMRTLPLFQFAVYGRYLDAYCIRKRVFSNFCKGKMHVLRTPLSENF